MQFNYAKCEVLRILKNKHPILATYTIGECSIQEVPYIKYLGVTIIFSADLE